MRRAPGSNIGVQTSVVPVTLQRANTATPIFVTPMVPYDITLAFSVKVLDSDGGAVNSNPAIVYVMVKHNPNNIGTTGGNVPGITAIQPQQQQQQLQPIVPIKMQSVPLHSQILLLLLRHKWDHLILRIQFRH